VIQLQLNFIEKKDLGFNRENLYVLNVNGSEEVHSGYQVFADELLTHPDIKAVCRSNSFIAGGLGNTTATFTDVSDKKINGTIYVLGVDSHYINTYGMTLVAGRNFSEGRADSAAIVVNEATLKTYGYTDPEKAVGTEVLFGQEKYALIGVVKDFNFNTLHTKVEPACLYLFNTRFSRIAVRISGEVEEGVKLVSETWKKHFPNSIQDFSFAEDRVQNTYESEKRFSKIFFVFSFISLAIACLGLFSLVSFSVETRTKEIGIRKVLGASVATILGMLSKEFLQLVALAAGVALPIAYYFMNQWLQSFAYRITLSPFVFMLAGGSVLAIAWLTVSVRSIKAATMNPVDSLRSE
jgi:putative ABC transport system permease protein